MSFEQILDLILDAAIDMLRLLPFLFVTYLGMELLEARAGDKLQNIIRKANRSGPVWGAALGIVPQCGFSAAASSFYAGKVISMGTLLAVFLSTSDEMLPVFISQSVPMKTIISVLGLKFVIALITGYAAGTVFNRFYKHGDDHMDIHTVCEHEHCDCHSGALRSAIVHTIKIGGFIFIISSVLNILIEVFGVEKLSGVVSTLPIAGVLMCGIIGLIPNCAASVLLTQMYLTGIISAGAMMAGLLVGAGVGLLVLFRLEPDRKEALCITGILYVSGVVWGLLLEALGVVL